MVAPRKERTHPLASDVKQRMIERMGVLLATKGLQGASFSEVLEGSGAPRGSLYHHFPGGKDELVMAALDFGAARAFAHLETLAGRPAPEVARGFIAGWRALLQQASLTAGCALVAVTVAADSAALRTHAGAIFRDWRSRLAAALREGGIPDARAEGLAAGLMAACEGAVALARAEGSLAAFELMATEQVAAIEAATPKRGRSRKAAD